MGKMIMALKKLAKKINGKAPESDNVVGIINGIADDYQGILYDVVFNIAVGGTTEVKSGSILSFYNKVKEHDATAKARIEGYIDYAGTGLVCADVTLIQINEPDVQTGFRSIKLMASLPKELVNNIKAPAFYEVTVTPTVESPESDEDFNFGWDFNTYN